MPPKKTLLSDAHQALGGRMVDFAGWLMPVQYAGILQEHQAVRSSAGAFDISHMGEFFVSGSGALPWMESLFTNKLSSLEIGRCQYTLMLNESGGVIDDLIAYRIGEQEYLLIVNASKIDEDAAWLRKHLPPDSDIAFSDASDLFAAVAVQGPDSPAIYEKLFARPMPAKNCVEPFSLPCGNGWLGITGYTGEAGFEIFLETSDASSAETLWKSVLDAGATPCGLGARDTLRLEMCYPLNGSDLSPSTSPLEAGLGFFVDLEKGPFCGRDTLLSQKQNGLQKRLAALLVEGKAPPLRPHYPVFSGETQIGETTSGALSPSLNSGIAMAYLPAELAKIGTEVSVEIRGKKFPARIVRKPFYTRP